MNPYLCNKRFAFKFLWLNWFECFLISEKSYFILYSDGKVERHSAVLIIIVSIIFHQLCSSPIQLPCSIRKKRWKKGILLTGRLAFLLATSLGRPPFGPPKVLYSVSTCCSTFLHLSPANTFPFTLFSKCWLPLQFVFSPGYCRDGLH